MKNYEGLFTEPVEDAFIYRRGYLNSVLALSNEEAQKAAQKRKEYISPEKLWENRGKYLADFRGILGTPLFDRKTKNEVSKIYLGMDGQGYIYRLVFKFEKNIEFCGLLFVPFDVKEKIPLVIALHGGAGTPELMSDMYGENYYSHITRRLLDRKVAVFCPQLLIWDDKRFGNKYDRFALDAKFKMMGSSLTAFETECISGAIDYLSSQDFVDGEKIGITGLSYGGYYSLVCAILDERIKSVYSCCAFNDRMKNSRPDFVYRDVAEKFLDAEMTALIFPRALYIEVGKYDGIFKCDGALSEIKELEKYYAKQPDKLIFSLVEGGHMYSSTDEGIEFLVNNLK